jgi:hypothetical protein
MRHADAAARIDAFDALSPAERLELERHAAECAECGAALAALRSILEGARTLPCAMPPARDLWPALAASLQDAPPQPRTAAAARVPRWAIAAAVVAVGATCIGLGMRRDARRPAPFVASDDAFPAVVSGLALQCLGAGKSLQASLAGGVPAAAATDLSAGLAILDRSIDETRAALASAPHDPGLERMLAARYQQKLALLHAALLRVEST